MDEIRIPVTDIFDLHSIPPRDVKGVVEEYLAEAHRLGFGLALVGLAKRHPLALVLRRSYRPREYQTLLHLVDWSKAREAAALPDARLPHVEIAVL